MRVKSALRGINEVSMVLQRKVRDEGATIDEGRGRTYRIGGYGDYRHGDLPLKRWHVVDEAVRIFPLRERYRQRAERVLFWPTRKAFQWWQTRHRDAERDNDLTEV